MVAKTQHNARSGCPVACALDIIGDHWSLLIVHFMTFLNLHEYKEFMEMPEKISTNILSERLKKLEKNGIIASIDHPLSQRRKLYYLTKQGKDLIYILMPMMTWSNKYLSDVVDIPEDKRKLIAQNPEKMIETTLKKLQEWENEFLKK